MQIMAQLDNSACSTDLRDGTEAISSATVNILSAWSKFRNVCFQTYLSQFKGKARHKCRKSYSRCGRAVVDQTVQHTQQVIFPVQITESLLHNTGKHLVLEVLQRKNVFPLEKRESCMTGVWSKLL